MTSPKNTIATMVRNRIQSVRSLAIVCLQLLYQALEFAATVLEIFKLVETGAGGSEKHRVAAFRACVGLGHCSFDGAGTQQRYGSAQLGLNLIRRGANQQRTVGLGIQRSGQQRIITVLVL